MEKKIFRIQRKIDRLYAKLEIELTTKRTLQNLGFSMQEKGCVYIIVATKLAMQQPEFLLQMPLLYAEIAQMYGIIKEEVEGEITKVIRHWWQKERSLRLNGKKNVDYDFYRESIPTNQECLQKLIRIVSQERTKNRQ